MVVTGAYKPTYNWGGGHIVDMDWHELTWITGNWSWLIRIKLNFLILLMGNERVKIHVL